MRRATPCPYRSAAAHRRADNQRSRALHAECVREFGKLGVGHLFEGSVREAELNRVLVSCITSGETGAALRGLPDRFEAFVTYCRRNRAWVAALLAAAKENAPTRGR